MPPRHHLLPLIRKWLQPFIVAMLCVPFLGYVHVLLHHLPSPFTCPRCTYCRKTEQDDDDTFAEVEARLRAEKEAHAKKIAAENAKKRKPPPVMLKRPKFVTSGQGTSRTCLCIHSFSR